MAISRLDSRRRALAGVAIVGLIGTGSVVSGQQPAGGLPNIGEQILAALGALQASVDALGAVAESTVRTTPAVFIEHTVRCTATNVSSEPRTIKIETVSGLSGTVLATLNDPFAAGQAGTVSFFDVAGGGTRYCRFTVLDGTRADIRGSLASESASNGLLVALPAE